jgi:ribosomal protein S6--L-glutamate ligase
MLPGVERDYGLVFLGGEYLASYARVRAGASWNTTIHSGGFYEAFEPKPEVIELADRAQRLFGLDFTSVDVVVTPGGPLVFEVSAFGGFRGLKEGAGIDPASLYADYVLGKIGAK